MQSPRLLTHSYNCSFSPSCVIPFLHDNFIKLSRGVGEVFSLFLSGLRRSSSSLLAAVVWFIPIGSPATASTMTLETYNNWVFHFVDEEFVLVQSRRDQEDSELLTFVFEKGRCHQARQIFEVFTMSNHPQLNLLLNEPLELRDNGSPAEGKVIHIQPHMGGNILLVDMGVYKNNDILKYYSYYERFRVTVTKHPLEQTIAINHLFDMPTSEWKIPDLKEVLQRAEHHCKRIPDPLVVSLFNPQKGGKI